MQSHQLTPSVNYQERLRPFAYLALMDMTRLPQGNFDEYKANEPGYLETLIKAFLLSKKEPKDGKLSHELFKRVHKAATAHLPVNEGGCYKTHTNNFEVHLRRYERPKMGKHSPEEEFPVVVPDYSATNLGVLEFIDYWLLRLKSPVHGLGFESKTMTDFGACIAMREGVLTLMTMGEGKKEFVPFNCDKHVPLILEYVKEFDLKFKIDSFLYDDEDIVPLVHAHMQLLFNEFHAEIALAKDDEAKIIAIARCLQHVAQLHPFRDGNIRTCYIILNKLLHDHGLAFSLMINPNRFDCCDLDEVVRTVKDGQAIFQQLLNNTNLQEVEIQTSEVMRLLKKIHCKAETLENPALVDEFIDLVLLQKTLVPQNTETLNNPACMFSASAASPAALLIDKVKALLPHQAESPIIAALKEGKFGLALRRSCIGNVPKIVELILAEKDFLKIDVNEVSENNPKTALDWFEQMTKDSSEKDLVREKLVGAGAVRSLKLTI